MLHLLICLVAWALFVPAEPQNEYTIMYLSQTPPVLYTYNFKRAQHCLRKVSHIQNQ